MNRYGSADRFIPLPFEDYSSTVKRLPNGLYEYVGCFNNNLLNEAALARLLEILKNETYAILSACRRSFSKKENVRRNRILRGILNRHKLGPYQLVGHWLEAPDGKKWNEVPMSEFTGAIERSYLVRKPDDMSHDEFKVVLANCLRNDGAVQDCGVVHGAGDSWHLYFADGSEDRLGDKISFHKVSQAYSRRVKKIDMPFVFECVEEPGSNFGSMMFNCHNIKYLI